MKALSIRQPWAWLIVNGHKDIENRSWPTRFRGPVLIHAAKGMTGTEYNDAYFFALDQGITIPHFNDLERGGIVGVATVTGCSDDCLSPWFFGKFGFQLAEAKSLPFRPCKGRLGFFEVEHQEVAHG
ncbi:ASCH domain-containing protein [Pseudomonas aeruginosa]